jgi:anti-sigma B factor antagonist
MPRLFCRRADRTLEEEGRFMTESGTEPARIVFQNEKTATVQVQGEIDMTTSPLLRSRVAECLGQGCTEVTLDMSHLDFIDSSGIQVLVWLLKELRARDGRLIIRNPPTMAEKVLAISGLTPYLSIRDSRSKDVEPEDRA